MTELVEKIKTVNERLRKGEPHNITEDKHNPNHVTTGYKPQSIIDAMNCEIGLGQWGFAEISAELLTGEKSQIVVTRVEVWLAGVEFKPSAYGQGRVTAGDIGDAFKAGQTDAIKKALAYFSIGARAYHGLLQKGGASGGK